MGLAEDDGRCANESASECVAEQVSACDFESANDLIVARHEIEMESVKNFSVCDACSSGRYDFLDGVSSGLNPLKVLKFI